MRSILHGCFKDSWVIIVNASSLIGTTAVTSTLGFVYWWLATRLFKPIDVGLASAGISSMLLLGEFSVLGFGTLLIGELPRQPDKEDILISMSLILVGGMGLVLGLIFSFLAPILSTDLQLLVDDYRHIALFALGVSLTAVTIVIDQALMGLLRGEIQFSRNTLFAIAKLILLLVAGYWVVNKSGLTIYATWIAGSFLSFLCLIGFLLLRGKGIITFRPQWRLLRGLSRSAIGHHALNLALQGPNMILPVLVTVLISAAANANFYVSWMMAGFTFVGPYALATVLYAVASANYENLKRKIRTTVGLSLVVGLIASGIFLVFGGRILCLFGSSYAEQAGWSLRILVLGVFPIIIKAHYVAIYRTYGRIYSAAIQMAAAAIFELVVAGVGGVLGGLLGLSIGWLVAVLIEAVFLLPRVYKVASGAET
jgi:O-antigen/teichoic acid export membrane protein